MHEKSSPTEEEETYPLRGRDRGGRGDKSTKGGVVMLISLNKESCSTEEEDDDDHEEEHYGDLQLKQAHVWVGSFIINTH